MTKQEFLRQIAYYAGPNSRFQITHERDQVIAAQYRAFDPKLADLIEEASKKWHGVYLYMKSKVDPTSSD